MFGNLRSEDALLFEQLGRITRDLEGSARLLERLLAEPRSAAAGIALEAQELAADVAPPRDDVNVRAFTGFAMRLDATEYRELAMALDAAAEAIHEALAHVKSSTAAMHPTDFRRSPTRCRLRRRRSGAQYPSPVREATSSFVAAVTSNVWPTSARRSTSTASRRCSPAFPT